MARRSVTTNQLTPNTTIMIRGHLTFSRIASQVMGEELEKDKIRRRNRNQNPIDRPYTTASICDAMVIYMNPTNKTPEDIYAEESLYQSRSSQNSGWSYTAYNKSPRLPWVGVLAEDGKTVKEIHPEGELASGLDVTLVMRVFNSPQNNGVSLDGIILHEPVRYWSGLAGSGLADRGITFQAAPQADPAPTAAQPAVPAQGPATPVYNNNPTYQNPMQGQPISAPVGNPFSNKQPDANPASQQAFNPSFNAQPQAAMPPQGFMNAPQPAPANAPQAVPGPFGNQGFTGSENSGGIRYNPSDRSY